MLKLPHLRDRGARTKRGAEIIGTLFRYGLEAVFDRIKLARKFPFTEPRHKGTAVLSMPQRVRLAFEELGPTFIKLGQVLSTRPDILPAEYIAEFEKLQDDVAPVPFEDVKALVESSLKKPLGSVFGYFRAKPIASASIAQVHFAKLPDGRRVAVKVRRPGIERLIATDTEIILELAGYLKDRVLVDEIWRPVELAREFQRSIKDELDFAKELANQKKFLVNFEGEERIRIPAVYEELSTGEVLTMEYIAGRKIKSVINDTRGRFPKKEIAAIAARAGIKQIFVDKFFHGDLHPGNIFWLDKTRQLALVDFGLVASLGGEEVRSLILMLGGFLDQDTDQVIFALEGLNIVRSSRQAAEIRRSVEILLGKYHDASVKDIKIAVLIEEIFGLMLEYRLRLPSNLVMMAKSIVAADGMALQIDPDFNMASFVKPYVEEAARGELSFDHLKKEGGRFLRGSWRLMSGLPYDLYWLLRNLKNNEFQIKFVHADLERQLRGITSSANRLSVSLIAAALIIGSSYLINSLRTLGIIGFIIAALLGLSLLISMFRTRKR
jgi:ubiquinone biosynthesis protein